MCRLNFTCAVSDGSCKCCNESELLDTYLPIPAAFTGCSNASIILMLFTSISKQNELMASISARTKETLAQAEILEQTIALKRSRENQPTEYLNPLAKLVNILYDEGYTHSFFLQIVSDIPRPAYKDRPFSLMIQIVDKNNQKITFYEKETFTIQLYSAESPPQLLKCNTSGESILAGTLEVQADSIILFRKVIIKEVSSHFSSGSLFLVISARNNKTIKPLVIEKISVKARKTKPEELGKKKIKIADTS